MSNKVDDGGPAYPKNDSVVPAFGNKGPVTSVGHEGMSLRDWFAGQALCGWIGSYGPDDGRPNAEASASIAYELADAMLAARKAGQP